MLVLALDTASQFCSAALAEDGALLAEAQDSIGKGHAEHLLPQIDGLMRQAGKSFAEIDRIGVNIGPGSFTGVRVGVAAARAFALALNIPAIGTSAFAALYAQALAALPQQASRKNKPAVYVVLKAPQNSFYWQYFPASGAASKPQSGAATEIAAFIQGNLADETAPKSLILGSGAEELAALLPRAQAARLSLCGRDPTAAIAFYALAASQASPAEAADAPVPLYMRAPDAKPQTALPAQERSQFRAAPRRNRRKQQAKRQQRGALKRTH